MRRRHIRRSGNRSVIRSQSVEVEGIPSAPGGVSAGDGIYYRVQVSWNPVSGATMYEIWRNTTNDSGSASYIADYSASPYDDYGATPGVIYYYWLKAKNAYGTSGFSSSDFGSASPAPTITQQPQDVTVFVGQDADFTITVSGSEPLHYQWKKKRPECRRGQPDAFAY